MCIAAGVFPLTGFTSVPCWLPDHLTPMLGNGSCRQLKRQMVDSSRTIPVSSFHLARSSHSEVFQKYTDLCATGATINVQNMANNARASDDIGSSVSNRQKRTAGNSHIMLTPVEATTSKRTRRFATINSNMSTGHSGES